MELHHELALPVALVGVVDDDPAVRNSLKFSLEIEGFAVGIYANASELLQERDLGRFRCFVVDQHMPGTSGLDLIATLHARQIPVPVILITSHPPRTLTERAERAGVPIIEKPLLGNALSDKIREVIDSTPQSRLN